MYDLIVLGIGESGLLSARLAVQGGLRVALARLRGEEPEATPSGISDLQEHLWQLAALGVDVLPEVGQFIDGAGTLTWQTASRTLTVSQALLTSPCWFPTSATGSTMNLPQSQTVAVMGGTPEQIQRAIHLAQSKNTAHLLSRNTRLLPGEDPEFSQRLQHWLTTIGIRVWLACDQLPSIETELHQPARLQFSQQGQPQTLLIDKAYFPEKAAFPWEIFPPQLLKKLSTIDSQNPNYLPVNRALQTHHPQLYATGHWLKGYVTPTLVQREARHVIQQIVSKRNQSIDYNSIPLAIDLCLLWCRVGIPQTQEENNYFYGYEPYQSEGELRGMCKITTDNEGRLQSAWWWGRQAQTGINLLALAIAKKFTLSQLQHHLIVETEVGQILLSLVPG